MSQNPVITDLPAEQWTRSTRQSLCCRSCWPMSAPLTCGSARHVVERIGSMPLHYADDERAQRVLPRNPDPEEMGRGSESRVEVT